MFLIFLHKTYIESETPLIIINLVVAINFITQISVPGSSFDTRYALTSG